MKILQHMVSSEPVNWNAFRWNLQLVCSITICVQRNLVLPWQRLPQHSWFLWVCL